MEARMSGGRSVLIAATVIGLAAPAVALLSKVDAQPSAATPSQASVVTVCVAKKSGAMRQASKRKPCKKKTERTVTMNAQGATGPAGQPGPQGPPGPAGPTGATGPTGVFYARNASSVSVATANTIVVQLALPAGRYVVSGTTAGLAPAAAFARCTVTSDAPVEASPADISLDANDLEQLTATGKVTAANATTVRLTCVRYATTYDVYNSSLTAIAMGS
jgi:hypothetical protein